MDGVFSALAHEARRALLDALYERGGQSLGELCEGLEMSRQAVSKHLAILEEANLVVTFKDGREKKHYLNPMPIQEISERWIRKFDRRKLEALSALKEILEKGKE